MEPSEEDFKKLNYPDGPEKLKEEIPEEEKSIDNIDSNNDRIYINNFRKNELLTKQEVLLQISVWINAIMMHGND